MAVQDGGVEAGISIEVVWIVLPWYCGNEAFMVGGGGIGVWFEAGGLYSSG